MEVVEPVNTTEALLVRVFARAVVFAIAQPDDVDINEIFIPANSQRRVINQAVV